jgi:hypothetical protein
MHGTVYRFLLAIVRGDQQVKMIDIEGFVLCVSRLKMFNSHDEKHTW